MTKTLTPSLAFDINPSVRSGRRAARYPGHAVEPPGAANRGSEAAPGSAHLPETLSPPGVHGIGVPGDATASLLRSKAMRLCTCCTVNAEHAGAFLRLMLCLPAPPAHASGQLMSVSLKQCSQQLLQTCSKSATPAIRGSCGSRPLAVDTVRCGKLRP